MGIVKYGSKYIFRPDRNVSDEINQKARKALLQKFKPGTYVGRDEVNPILKSHFDFYDSRLRKVVPLLASRDAADFLLFQYDEANEILHGCSISDPEQKESWARIEPGFRRAIKYITELFCIRQNPGRPKVSKKLASQKLGEALLCAEHAADLSEISDRAYQIFPEDFELVLNDLSSRFVFETSVRGKHSDYDLRFGLRVARDREARERYMGKGFQFDIHTDSHTPFLDDAFVSVHGMSYSLFIGGLFDVIRGARPVSEEGNPTLFIRRTDLLDKLCESGRKRSIASLMLRGFTVTPHMLQKESRVIWNPKQESRAYRRGFFLFPHATGMHLAFSREMAKEAMIQLVVGGCYGKLPAEWLEPELEPALSKLSKASGDWFERIVGENLTNVGYHGGRVKRQLGRNATKIDVPPEVGELDYLGWHKERRELLLVEAKMTNSGIEARYWRDDLTAFTRGSKCHANQFRRKIEWVKLNMPEILKLLGAPADCSFSPFMVTLYPCIAAEFIDDFPCVSITELMLDLEAQV